MSEKEGRQNLTESTRQRLAPMGKLGFRGRSATPEERARILDAFFFEGARRVPYLQQYFVLMLLSATIAGFGLANNSARRSWPSPPPWSRVGAGAWRSRWPSCSPELRSPSA